MSFNLWRTSEVQNAVTFLSKVNQIWKHNLVEMYDLWVDLCNIKMNISIAQII
jgi:hypothetical protein